MAEWLGSALQKLLQRFESASDLQPQKAPSTSLGFFCAQRIRPSSLESEAKGAKTASAPCGALELSGIESSPLSRHRRPQGGNPYGSNGKPRCHCDSGASSFFSVYHSAYTHLKTGDWYVIRHPGRNEQKSRLADCRSRGSLPAKLKNRSSSCRCRHCTIRSPFSFAPLPSTIMNWPVGNPAESAPNMPKSPLYLAWQTKPS